MNLPPENHSEKLERAIHQTLRALPPRRAPRSLEARVFAELERRAALSWWRQSFAHWPLPARAVFFVAALALVKLTLTVAVWVMAGFDSASFLAALSTPVSWAQAGVSLVRGVTDFCFVIFRSIPPLWLYGTVAFVAAMYAALFGLGAAAYRTLYVSR
jgi:hypothetical protein